MFFLDVEFEVDGPWLGGGDAELPGCYFNNMYAANINQFRSRYIMTLEST